MHAERSQRWDEYAGWAEQRAERARRHAVIARRYAERDAADGNPRAELMHLREAELHERAAARQIAAAARLRALALQRALAGDSQRP